jgi:hypothetical protein
VRTGHSQNRENRSDGWRGQCAFTPPQKQHCNHPGEKTAANTSHQG